MIKYVHEMFIRDEEIQNSALFSTLQVWAVQRFRKEASDQGYVIVGDIHLYLLEGLKFEGEYLDKDGPHFMLKIEGDIIDTLEEKLEA